MGDDLDAPTTSRPLILTKFLVHEYPTSRFARMRSCECEAASVDRLGDSALAKKNYEDFLETLSAFAEKREAQEALAEWRCCRTAMRVGYE